MLFAASTLGERISLPCHVTNSTLCILCCCLVSFSSSSLSSRLSLACLPKLYLRPSPITDAAQHCALAPALLVFSVESPVACLSK